MARARRPRQRPGTTRRTTRSGAKPRTAARRPGQRAQQQQRTAKLGRGKRFSTAIDIGHYSVKIVTIAADESERFQIQNVTVQPIDLPKRSEKDVDFRQLRIDALKEAVHQHKRLKGQLVLAVPRELTAVRYLKLPSSRYDELKEMIILDAERHIPFPIEDVELDFEILEKISEHESKIMLVSAPRDEIDLLMDICREAGVMPECLDVDILGACRAYQQNGKTDETTAVIDFGRDSTCLGIMSGGKVLFSRSLSIGETRLLAQFPGASTWTDLRTRLAAIGALPPQERERVEKWIGDLYTDLMRSVSSFACEYPGSRVDRIILCGGGGYIPTGPTDSLAVRLKTNANAELPLGGDIPTDPSYHGPELAPAIGIALRNLQSNGRAVNLLPRELVAERARREQRAFWKSAFFLALIALLCGGAGLYLKWETKYSELTALRERIAELKPEFQELRKKEAKVEIVDSYLDREHSCLKVLSSVFESLPDNPPNNVALSRIVFKKGETLTLEGQVRTSDDINKVNSILLTMGPQPAAGKTKLFKNIYPGPRHSRELGFDGLRAWDFSFECELEYKEKEKELERVRNRLKHSRSRSSDD